MALTSGVASTAWETALYEVLDILRMAGGYSNFQYDYNKVGISDADATVITNGYKAYLVAKANAGRTFVDTRKANSSLPSGVQRETWEQGDKQVHPTL